MVPKDWLDRLNQSFRVLFAQGGTNQEEPVEINQVTHFKVSDPRFLSTAHVRAFLREIFSTRFMSQLGLMDQTDSTRFQNYVDWDDELYLLDGGASFLDFSFIEDKQEEKDPLNTMEKSEKSEPEQCEIHRAIYLKNQAEDLFLAEIRFVSRGLLLDNLYYLPEKNWVPLAEADLPEALERLRKIEMGNRMVTNMTALEVENQIQPGDDGAWIEVTDSKFPNVKSLKAFFQDIYTSDWIVQEHIFEGTNPLFKEENGKLYRLAADGVSFESTEENLRWVTNPSQTRLQAQFFIQPDTLQILDLVKSESGAYQLDKISLKQLTALKEP